MSSIDPKPEEQGFDPDKGPQEPAKPLDPAMNDMRPSDDPFKQADDAAADRPPDVQFPAGNPATVYDEAPESPRTVDPAAVTDAVTTTGTGSSIAIGCIAVAIVIVLVVVLVLTIVS